MTRKIVAVGLAAIVGAATGPSCNEAPIECPASKLALCDNAGERCVCADTCASSFECPAGQVCATNGGVCYHLEWPSCPTFGEACDVFDPCCGAAACVDGRCCAFEAGCEEIGEGGAGF